MMLPLGVVVASSVSLGSAERSPTRPQLRQHTPSPVIGARPVNADESGDDNALAAGDVAELERLFDNGRWTARCCCFGLCETGPGWHEAALGPEWRVAQVAEQRRDVAGTTAAHRARPGDHKLAAVFFECFAPLTP